MPIDVTVEDLISEFGWQCYPGLPLHSSIKNIYVRPDLVKAFERMEVSFQDIISKGCVNRHFFISKPRVVSYANKANAVYHYRYFVPGNNQDDSDFDYNDFYN